MKNKLWNVLLLIICISLDVYKRQVREGQRALVIDDFLAGGGTVRAICEMMKEFGIIVVGCGVAIATREPEIKRVEHYKSCLLYTSRIKTSRSRSPKRRPPASIRRFAMETFGRRAGR